MKDKKHAISKLMILIFFLIGTTIGGGYKIYDFMREKALSFDIHKATIQGSKEIKNWIKFKSKEENFTVRFPQQPDYITKEFPIPRTNDTLPYHEYHCDYNNRVVSVSYTILPQNWLKWGAKAVLKGAMKVIIAQLNGAHLVGQSTNTFKLHPSLDFEHYLDDQETVGTLILVGNTLYKIEIAYPANEREQMHNLLAQFIESFEPLKN